MVQDLYPQLGRARRLGMALKAARTSGDQEVVARRIWEAYKWNPKGKILDRLDDFTLIKFGAGFVIKAPGRTAFFATLEDAINRLADLFVDRMGAEALVDDKERACIREHLLKASQSKMLRK